MHFPRPVRTLAFVSATLFAPCALSAPVRAAADEWSPARLGFASSAVLDLIVTPNVLFTADAQRYVDATFDAMDARADTDARARLHAVRERLRPSAQAFDPADVSRSYRAATAAFERTLAPQPFAAYSLGSLTASVLFNARVLREEATDVDFRRAIGSAPPGPGAEPAIAAARAKLASDAPDAWESVAADAESLATALLGEAPPRLRPAPADVWALLVRGRPITDAGPRAGTTHLSLEVVYGDGRRRTFGAYPDGKYAFSATGGKLLCAFDREPATGPSRAYSLVPPHDVTYAAIAERFASACNAFDRRRPAFAYVPQDDKHSNDNAFVYGLLKAESLDVPQSL